MDFTELEACIALAETLNFARAAERVHLSPSALSRMIHRVENEAGVPLFERDTRQVFITPAGQQFLDFARQTLHEKNDLWISLQNPDDRLTGILRIYASVTACYSLLPPFVETLTHEHPSLRLSIETGDPAGAFQAVREGRADLALGALPEEGYPDMDCFFVRKTPLVFAASITGAYGNLPLLSEQGGKGLLHSADWIKRQSASSPSIHNRTEELETSSTSSMWKILETTPLLLPASGLARERFDIWCKKKGIHPLIAAESAGNEAVLALARLGLGLGLVPRIVLENSPFAAGLVLYRSEEALQEYDIGYIQKKEKPGADPERKRKAILSRIIRSVYHDTKEVL